MKLEVTPKGGRILKLAENEKKCAICGKNTAKSWFFCEISRKTYCNRCIFTEGCHYKAMKDHTDYLIDKVVVEE